MWISVFLISSILHITAGNEGCTLSGTNHPLQEITAFTGQSVLLPCSCTVRQFDTPRLTWTKLTLGCSLSDSNQLEIVRSPGQSVLLPCSCNELQAKPHKLTWTKLPAIPLTKCDLYRDRVAMFNTESSPGNLSVLLSFITKEDQGWYRCTINNQDTRDIHITVEGTDTVRTSGEAPSASSLQNNPIQYVLMAVLPVILIIAGMALYIYKRNKRKKTTGNNSRGSKTGGENNDEDDPNAMNATVQHRNANQEDTTTPLSAPDDPSVIYCTIVHMTGKGKAAVSLENSGEIEYASIKTGRSS
ncbi:uncharacterized protein LOC109895203 isoform X3 [Oncorhynchus kisutch]|uniref:uncharacterized protein LOC109895203 isoform X3 n=1 Tax=Oncorhynchus kisutch TaxID=8019 RepID=UPI0012DDC2FE|nr:uncharacterized protein LOC109895203 isoform X3 [Oncorhynchus kisutch]